MSDLPEIISHILSRCDVITIGRCRCISKQWRGIIESTHFIKLHLDYATNANSAAVFFKHKRLYHAPMDNLDMRHVPIISKVKPFSLVGSCNGLLLLRKNGIQSQEFCIMNPITNKHAYLPYSLPIFFIGPGIACAVVLAYGFGYDSFNDDYKVVRIAQECVPGRTVFLSTQITINSVKKGAVIYDKLPYFMETSANGLFVGGVLHWLMAKYNHDKILLIMGYDVGTDEIRELPLPDLKDEGKEFKYEGIVGLGVLGTWLAISNNYGGGMAVGFWAMKEYGNEESWTKLFSFPLARIFCRLVTPLGLSENDNLVLLELDRKQLILYDRNANDVTSLMHKPQGEAMVCFRSIAPLPSAENGQMDRDQKRSTRKKRDDFLSISFKLKL